MRAPRIPDDRIVTAAEMRSLLREHANDILRADREAKAAKIAASGPRPRRKKRKKSMWVRRAGLIEAAIAQRQAAEPRQKIYVIGSADHPIKIGIARNPERRLKEIQTGCPQRLRLYAAVDVPEGCKARALERMCHEELTDYQLTGEWFDLSPVDAVETVRSVVRREGFRAQQKQALVVTRS